MEPFPGYSLKNFFWLVEKLSNIADVIVYLSKMLAAIFRVTALAGCCAGSTYNNNLS